MSTVWFLVDNGSLAPAATLSLRRLAGRLSDATGVVMEPVSLLHSSGVDPVLLEGVPAEIFEPAIIRRAQQGVRDFRVLPLFFGPTRALTGYLPERAASLASRFPGLQVRQAPWLVRLPGDGSEVLTGNDVGDPGDGLDVIADCLEAGILEMLSSRELVALVDHGSPEPRVTRVRNRLAAELCRRLAGRVLGVRPCSMERREGDAYLFNEPLLERLLREPAVKRVNVLVSMLFLQPGRHAGPQGDVAEICAAAQAEEPSLKIRQTGLVGEQPQLVGLLKRRFEALCSLS